MRTSAAFPAAARPAGALLAVVLLAACNGAPASQSAAPSAPWTSARLCAAITTLTDAVAVGPAPQPVLRELESGTQQVRDPADLVQAAQQLLTSHHGLDLTDPQSVAAYEIAAAHSRTLCVQLPSPAAPSPSPSPHSAAAAPAPAGDMQDPGAARAVDPSVTRPSMRA